MAGNDDGDGGGGCGGYDVNRSSSGDTGGGTSSNIGQGNSRELNLGWKLTCQATY